MALVISRRKVNGPASQLSLMLPLLVDFNDVLHSRDEVTLKFLLVPVRLRGLCMLDVVVRRHHCLRLLARS